jgi:hypothetical protein
MMGFYPAGTLHLQVLTVFNEFFFRRPIVPGTGITTQIYPAFLFACNADLCLIEIITMRRI